MSDVLRIAIAEDEAILSLVLSKLLEKAGYTVVARVSDGPGAVAVVEDKQPDLVLMDIAMPGDWDGIEACARIKKQYPDVRVVFITAYPRDTFHDRLAGLTFDGYLTKPVRIEHVQKAIAAFR